MSWRDEWMALRQRIRGLIAAADVYSRLSSLDQQDSQGGSSALRDQASKIHRLIVKFDSEYKHLLPTRARDSLREWLAEHQNKFTPPSTNETAYRDRQLLTGWLPILAAFESELSYYLSDRQQQLRLRSERAFAHLQRLIAADQHVQQRWHDAFKDGEVACEKLGAAHLLLHGIWAFKVDAAGAKTDLVFPEPIDLDEVERAAEGLVLTEWKKAEPGNLERRFTEAREQAKLYAAEPLGGIELRDYRYVVVVTEKRVKPLPDDREENGVLWRHINIAVKPETPAKAGRRRRQED